MRIAAFALACVGSFPGLAAAHRLEVEATAEGTAVRIRAWYEGDDPADAARVTLLDAAGTRVGDGTTDAQGLCTLPRPRAGKYTIVVDDGAGHRTELPIAIPESESELAEAHTDHRNRWLMASLGVLLIAGATVALRRMRRRATT